MATFIEMVTDIQDDYVNESMTAQNVKDAINSAIKHYERQRFWFNEFASTFLTVVNQEYYGSADLADIPNMVEIVNMRITPDMGAYVTPGYWDDGYVSSASTNGANTVMPAKFQDIDDMQSGFDTGQPSLYTYYNKKIRFFPAPNAIYVVRVSYVTRYTALSADGDTNAWTEEGYELIKQSAKRRLALNKLASSDLAEMASGLEMEAFSEILAENRRRRPNKLLHTADIAASGGYNIFTGT